MDFLNKSKSTSSVTFVPPQIFHQCLNIIPLFFLWVISMPFPISFQNQLPIALYQA
jgi:hypothetical protein